MIALPPISAGLAAIFAAALVAAVLLLRRESGVRLRTERERDIVQARLQFYATMSHEMRTALNGVIGVAGAMLELPLGAKERQHTQLILESGSHLLRVINDVLDMSRIDAGKLKLIETAFDVRKTVRSVVEILEVDARAKGIALTLEIADDIPRRAGGDPQRLRQVLLNIIGNAVKFTREGGVSVRVAREPSETGTARLSFVVADTGIGISPEGRARLFNEFAQADRSITRRFGGSGLGLAISKALVERMGGAISVESAPGSGSTFRFDIVVRARRASDDPNAPNIDPAVSTAKFDVLVVEDNATNQLVFRTMLEGMGHRVTAVEGGHEAIEHIGRSRFDLILMDVMMPELDGLEATRRIRALPEPARSIPIIGLSAANDVDDAVAGRAAGMNHFATKPITGPQLAEVIGQVMQSVARPLHQHHRGGVENRGFDPAVLDRLSSDIGGEAALNVVRVFIRDAGQTVDAMRMQAIVGQLAEVTFNARALGGAARGLGLLRIGRLANELESDAERGDADSVRDRLDVLRPLIAEDLDELREWRPEVA